MEIMPRARHGVKLVLKEHQRRKEVIKENEQELTEEQTENPGSRRISD